MRTELDLSAWVQSYPGSFSLHQRLASECPAAKVLCFQNDQLSTGASVRYHKTTGMYILDVSPAVPDGDLAHELCHILNRCQGNEKDFLQSFESSSDRILFINDLCRMYEHKHVHRLLQEHGLIQEDEPWQKYLGLLAAEPEEGELHPRRIILLCNLLNTGKDKLNKYKARIRKLAPLTLDTAEAMMKNSPLTLRSSDSECLRDIFAKLEKFQAKFNTVYDPRFYRTTFSRGFLLTPLFSSDELEKSVLETLRFEPGPEGIWCFKGVLPYALGILPPEQKEAPRDTVLRVNSLRLGNFLETYQIRYCLSDPA